MHAPVSYTHLVDNLSCYNVDKWKIMSSIKTIHTNLTVKLAHEIPHLINNIQQEILIWLNRLRQVLIGCYSLFSVMRIWLYLFPFLMSLTIPIFLLFPHFFPTFRVWRFAADRCKSTTSTNSKLKVHKIYFRERRM